MAKPTENPTWAESGTVTEPSAGKKSTGWTAAGERPPYQFFNWWQRAVARWIEYLEDTTDDLAGLVDQYSAIVGSGGLATHANTATGLQAAIDASTTGDRILILDDIEWDFDGGDTEVQITRQDMELEIHPRVTFSKAVMGAPAGKNCLVVAADGVRIRGGRFASWGDSGDICINIQAASDYTMVSHARFNGADTEIDDNNGKSAIFGNIVE
jgi:hypothetical protein